MMLCLYAPSDEGHATAGPRPAVREEKFVVTALLGDPNMFGDKPGSHELLLVGNGKINATSLTMFYPGSFITGGYRSQFGNDVIADFVGVATDCRTDDGAQISRGVAKLTEGFGDTNARSASTAAPSSVGHREG
jgi:hypothetical protein